MEPDFHTKLQMIAIKAIDDGNPENNGSTHARAGIFMLSCR